MDSELSFCMAYCSKNGCQPYILRVFDDECDGIRFIKKAFLAAVKDGRTTTAEIYNDKQVCFERLTKRMKPLRTVIEIVEF